MDDPQEHPNRITLALASALMALSTIPVHAPLDRVRRPNRFFCDGIEMSVLNVVDTKGFSSGGQNGGQADVERATLLAAAARLDWAWLLRAGQPGHHGRPPTLASALGADPPAVPVDDPPGDVQSETQSR